MIRLYVGRCPHELPYQVRHRFPERGKHPREQVFLTELLIDTFLEDVTKEVLVETYSDFVLKAFNKEIVEGRLPAGYVQAFDEDGVPANDDKVEELGFGFPSIDEEIEYVEISDPWKE